MPDTLTPPALVPIPYQFVLLEDYPERRDCGENCDAQAEPCPLYGGADPFFLQLRNEPQPLPVCLDPSRGGTLDDPCGGSFLNVDVTGSASLWTLTGSWKYDSNPAVARLYCDAPYLAGEAVLGLGTWQATQAGVYRFSFNLHTITNGEVRLAVGSLTSPAYTIPGTYDWVVFLDPGSLFLPLRLLSTLGTDAEVISVRIGSAAAAWTGYEIGGWELSPDGHGWQHLPAFNNPLTLNYGLALNTYKITVRIAGLSDPQAYLDVYHDTLLLRRLRGNGTTTIYQLLNTTSGFLRFQPSANWDGILYLDEVALSPRGHQFGLVQGNYHAAELNPIYYEGDYVTLGPVQFENLLDANFEPLPYGCYQVAVWDSTVAGALGELVNDPQLTSPGAWFVNPSAGSYNWATDPAIPPPYYGEQFQGFLFRGSIEQDLPDLFADNCYQVTIHLNYSLDNSGTPQPFNGTFQAFLGGNALGPLITPDKPTVLNYTVPVQPTTGGIYLEFFDSTFAVSYISVRPCSIALPVSTSTFRSQCLEFRPEVDCDSAYLEGSIPGTYRVTPNVPNHNEWRSPVAYGFQWNRYFKLAQRCPTYFLNPIADGSDDRYAYRNGRNLRTAGELEATWDLVLGAQGYISHAALATLAKTQQVRIVRGYDPTTLAGDLYLITSDDYAPNWPKNARAHVADVQLEVVRLEKSRRYLRAIF